MLYEQNGFRNSVMMAVPAATTDFEQLKKIASNPQVASVNADSVGTFKANQLQYLVAGQLDNGKRSNDTYHNCSLVLIDFDEISDEQQFLSKVSAVFSKISYILWPSISYGYKGIRYHLAIDPSRPLVDKAEKTSVISMINQWLGVASDEAMTTWVQMFSAPVETQANAGKIVIHDGGQLDVDATIAIYKPEQKETRIEAVFHVGQPALKPSILADVIQMPKQKSHHSISQPKALSAIATWAEKHADELADEAFFVRTIRFLVEEENEGNLSKSTVDAAGKLLALHNPDWEIDNQAKIDAQRHESLQQNKLSFAQFFSAVDGPDWIMTTAKGQPLYNSTANTVAWLNWDIEQGKTGLVSIKYNSFSKLYEIKDSKGLRALSDADVRSLQFDMQHVSNFNVTKDSLFDGVYVFGDRHSYNPIVDAIKAAKWDGRKRISNVFAKYLGAEDNDYTRKINRVWLLQLVNRLVNPGAKADIVPILIGKQGLGKSTLARRLAYCDDYFSDSLRDMMGNKDELSKLAGKSIVELGELNSMRKSSIEDTKSFISKQADDFRPAYARTVQTFKRTASFIGTSNYSDVLVDSTGERRFWPIQCGVNKAVKSVFDLTGEDAEVLQMYAEAFAALKVGEKPYLTHNEIVALMPSQREFKKYDLVVDALESELGVLINQGKKCISKRELATETLRFVHIKEDQNGDNPERSKVNYASVLSRVGKLMGARNDWNYKQVRVEDGKREYMYVLEEN